MINLASYQHSLVNLRVPHCCTSLGLSILLLAIDELYLSLYIFRLLDWFILLDFRFLCLGSGRPRFRSKLYV